MTITGLPRAGRAEPTGSPGAVSGQTPQRGRKQAWRAGGEGSAAVEANARPATKIAATAPTAESTARSVAALYSRVSNRVDGDGRTAASLQPTQLAAARHTPTTALQHRGQCVLVCAGVSSHAEPRRAIVSRPERSAGSLPAGQLTVAPERSSRRRPAGTFPARTDRPVGGRVRPAQRTSQNVCDWTAAQEHHWYLHTAQTGPS